MANKNKVYVTGDTPFETVVQSDKDGANLVFDPDDFKSLSVTQLNELSTTNKQRYNVVRELAEERKNRTDVDEAVARSFRVEGSAVNARQRLAIVQKRPGWRHRWERPAMLDVRRAQGWKLAGKEWKTYRDSKDGVHRIGSEGQEELLLIEIPEAQYKKLKTEKKRRRQRAFQAIEGQTREDLRRLSRVANDGEGVDVVDDTTKADFRPVTQE